LSDLRLKQLRDWLNSVGLNEYDMEPASNDASFRRYFRVWHERDRFIVMDAPPAQEDCRPFVAVAQALKDFGLNVPKVLEMDLEQGFLLLSDLGHEQYLEVLTDKNVDQLYADAITALVKLQKNGPSDSCALPAYSRELLLSEMALFSDWLMQTHLGLGPERAQSLEPVYGYLADKALEQPLVWVHRDYHSRNLMVTPESNPGVLDFQDAVLGPVAYDVVSLLKDCYISWPRDRVEAWCLQYFNQASEAGVLRGVEFEQFLRWFDLMGVQRHLKAAGIFARLNHRDAKPAYLKDIPRTLGHIMPVCERDQRLAPLAEVLAVVLAKL